MSSLKGGTPRGSQQKVDIGGESYIVAGEDQVTQAGGGARSWAVTQTPLQEGDTSKEFSVSLGDFSQGAGFTFATQPGVYDYANGWDASAPGKPGTWARRATGASLPPTVDYQGWILPVSTYVYVMRGRFCCKYAMDDTQDAVWPIIETHDFGSGVIVTGRPVVFKGNAYVPLRNGAGGSLHVWHELSGIRVTTVQQQTIAIAGASGGTFTVTFDGKTSAAITAAAANAGAAAAALQTALRAIAGLEQVGVGASGSSPNWTYTVTMTAVAGGLGSNTPPQMTSTSSLTGGGPTITHTITVAGLGDTWTGGPAGKEASCFIVNGTKLWKANANNIAACAVTPTTGGNWGADSEVGESGREITDLGTYEGDNLVAKTDGLYRFTEDLQSVQELPDLSSVVDSFNGIGMEFSNGYELIPHKTGLIRWRPGAYQFVGPEQEGALEGSLSRGWGRVASLAPFGKQLFFASNDAYDGVGVIGSLLPQMASDGRGPLIPHIHFVGTNSYFESVRVVTSTTQPQAPQIPANWSDDGSNGGSLSWSNPGNAAVSDDSRATATGTGTTHYLKGLAPPLNIPTGATIQGILAEVERSGWSSYASTDSLSGLVQWHDATYATARGGAGSSVVDLSGGPYFTGQYLAGGTYFFYEALFSFDTSAIPDGATILSATLAFTGNGAGLPFSGTTLQARLYDFGVSITIGDFVAGASLGSRPLMASAPMTGFPVSGGTGRPAMTSDPTFVSNINTTGSTRVILCIDDQVSGVAPADGTGPLTVYTHTAGANAPALTVTYKDVLDNVVKLVVGGTVSGTNMADGVNQWPGTDTVASYGGSTTLWGTTPTVAQLNAPDFGLVIAAQNSAGAGSFAVDSARMTVYYSVPGISDPQSFLMALSLNGAKDTATPQVYKLPRANLPVVNDPNIARATANVQLNSSRYAQPSRNLQKTYRNLELWLDAAPQANTPGLQVWAAVDDGTPFQLLDGGGAAATLFTSGARQLFFPSTAAAVGHYCQLQFRVPALGGGTVPLAASFRDCTLHGVVDPRMADTISATLLLGDGEFVDRTSIRRSVRAQRAALRALARPTSAAVPYRDINGDTGYVKVVSLSIREVRLKEYDEPVSVAQLVIREMPFV